MIKTGKRETVKNSYPCRITIIIVACVIVVWFNVKRSEFNFDPMLTANTKLDIAVHDVFITINQDLSKFFGNFPKNKRHFNNSLFNKQAVKFLSVRFQ